MIRPHFLLALPFLLLTACGVPMTLKYENPESGLSAGYSSKGGLAIGYRPLAEK